ncbi:MAG: tetratricopeptide repeat protein [Candidatus Aegiribacteria sp.]|nr:tetratricopeptide repeat protein [Candidatus Aegiribacteria sp.]
MTDNVSVRELEKLESEWVSNPSSILCSRLAEILRQMGRLDESREVADTGLRRWKNNTSITVVLGKCYRDLGLLEKAMESFETVNSVQPQNLVALKNLAEIHFKKENWSEAVNFFEEYLFEHPGDDEARDKLEEARSWKNSSDQVSLETEEDVPEHDSDAFPKTERMNKVLESQGILTKIFSESEETESEGYSMEEESYIVETSPDSLIAFFSDEEKQNLNLKPYDSEEE